MVTWIEVPAPRRLFATLEQHRMVSTDEWELLTVRHAPDATFEGHLTFALKYEGLDLAVLKRPGEWTCGNTRRFRRP